MLHKPEASELPENHSSPETLNSFFQIAIDGTVASGKGTISRILAEQLEGFIQLDTGAMYRCVALLTLRNGLSPGDDQSILDALVRSKIELLSPTEDQRDGRSVTVLLNDEDVSWQIRETEISMMSAITSQHPRIREELVRRQQQIARQRNIIMEGRDITHTVLPNAQLKIYTDADPIVRAERRYRQLLSQGLEVTLEKVYQDLIVRDQRDLEKNLRRVPGVWEIDTTFLTPEEITTQIVERVHVLQSLR